MGKKRDTLPSPTLHSVSVRRRTVRSRAAFCFGSAHKVRSQAFDKCTVGSVVNRLPGEKRLFFTAHPTPPSGSVSDIWAVYCFFNYHRNATPGYTRSALVSCRCSELKVLCIMLFSPPLLSLCVCTEVDEHVGSDFSIKLYFLTALALFALAE